MTDAVLVASYLGAWFVIRIVAIRRSGKAIVQKRSPRFTWIALLACLVVAVGFVVVRVFSTAPSMPESWMKLGGGATIIGAALLLDVISIFYLGRNYSLEIAVKENHKIAQGGPYRFVRHPIYLGNIIGYFGLCVIIDFWVAWIALGAKVVGFALMAKNEESALIENLGENYVKYRERVPWRLVPWIV